MQSSSPLPDLRRQLFFRSLFLGLRKCSSFSRYNPKFLRCRNCNSPGSCICSVSKKAEQTFYLQLRQSRRPYRFANSLLNFFSAAVSAYESVSRLNSPQPVKSLGAVAVSSVVGFLGNELVAKFRIKVGKEIGSELS
jgi:hypothetical protein